MSLVQPCGCSLVRDSETGALTNHYRCKTHLTEQLAGGGMTVEQYQQLGILDEYRLINQQRYLDQIIGSLGRFPPAQENSKALEIGGGISPYAGELIRLGYEYTLVEPSVEACGFMREHYPESIVHCTTFGTGFSRLKSNSYDLILAAHSLEHMKDAPMALSCMARLLSPTGSLYLIIPDDQDLMNPGHYWFFNETSIRNAAQACGLRVTSLVVRRFVEIEKFIYCSMCLED